MINNLDHLISLVKSLPKKVIAVAAAEDAEILEVVEETEKIGLAQFILVGDKRKIEHLALTHHKTINCKIIDEPDHQKAAERAVKLVVDKEADAVMKGLLHTGVFLKAVLKKDGGLNIGKFISQISIFEKPSGDGLMLLTDCAMAIAPNLEEKKKIIENAIEIAQIIGYEMPKVALLSAVETINPEIQDTLDAAILSKMADRGQIKGGIVDGPFALDNAVSVEAAKHKGITGEVAGRADILIAPNLQVGNVIHKSITYFACKDLASAIVGAGAPVIITSRTDTVRTKVLTIALACYIAKASV
ncbi:MAG: bifunctional enoyl-CoA hydratase/phosphate acetyltransferase [Eubacteriales bacterium]|nr:bifunctional enoyl-CoA hydratase/phosphate acetyltransferase [Eubacteriales bacterium]